MKIFLSAQSKQADEYTIKNEPVKSVDLMERAANGAFRKLMELYPESNRFVVFVGTGNNGGDGLVIARLLAETGKNVRICIVRISNRVTDDFLININRLKEQNKTSISEITTESIFPNILPEEIIIDALFGTGLSGKLNGFAANIVKQINHAGSEIVSIDIPSGLLGEENEIGNVAVINANHTLTFQYPKLAFMFPENENFIGMFHIIDIGIHKEYIKNTTTPFHYFCHNDIVLKKRNKFSHKGNYGHALIFASSFGKAGACVLAAKAAHRVGAGLISAAVPLCNYEILQVSSPETMLKIDKSEKFLSYLPDLIEFNAVAIGPGIGLHEETKALLKNLILNYKKPIVFDADALTILSEHMDWLKFIPENSIFTPHPKEFERLCGKTKNNRDRLLKQIDFAKNYKIIVVLKGAHSTIALPNGNVYFNSSGNPGMATAGSGDVLTGCIVSLLAQCYSPSDSAIIGTYLHGLAGDLANMKMGQIALIASDIIQCLPIALKTFEKSVPVNEMFSGF